MHACIHTCIHTYIHTYIHKYTHTYIHTYILTYLHTYITYIHTYIHTYIQCKAHNVRRWYMRYTLDFLGEMSHADHHRNPRFVQTSSTYLPTYLHSHIPACRSSANEPTYQQPTCLLTYLPTYLPTYRKALRPSYLGFDAFYWCFVLPGEKLGLFWDVRASGGKIRCE